MFAGSVSGLDGDIGTALKRQASWALALFGPDVPDTARLDFVLSGSSAASAPGVDGTAERLALAASFRKLPDETLDWDFVFWFATVADIPPTVTWEDFRLLASKVSTAASRQGVRNPIVASVLDFMVETEQLGPELSRILLPTAAKVKLQASTWSAVPDEIDEAVIASLDVSVLSILATALKKLFPGGGPAWAVAVRDLCVQKKLENKIRSGKHGMQKNSRRLLQADRLHRRRQSASPPDRLHRRRQSASPPHRLRRRRQTASPPDRQAGRQESRPLASGIQLSRSSWSAISCAWITRSAKSFAIARPRLQRSERRRSR